MFELVCEPKPRGQVLMFTICVVAKKTPLASMNFLTLQALVDWEIGEFGMTNDQFAVVVETVAEFLDCTYMERQEQVFRRHIGRIKRSIPLQAAKMVV